MVATLQTKYQVQKRANRLARAEHPKFKGSTTCWSTCAPALGFVHQASKLAIIASVVGVLASSSAIRIVWLIFLERRSASALRGIDSSWMRYAALKARTIRRQRALERFAKAGGPVLLVALKAAAALVLVTALWYNSRRPERQPPGRTCGSPFTRIERMTFALHCLELVTQLHESKRHIGTLFGSLPLSLQWVVPCTALLLADLPILSQVRPAASLEVALGSRLMRPRLHARIEDEVRVRELQSAAFEKLHKGTHHCSWMGDPYDARRKAVDVNKGRTNDLFRQALQAALADPRITAAEERVLLLDGPAGISSHIAIDPSLMW
ncbi:hypothetical protein CYMTET_23582 [Cymbomonas tetramitiformis]|uniref:Uncharacterized protein n=1 Tax=Cymbomonas tetramitiformis TaxID=36881 RepID=A0AAE0FYB9_9CHLO|nr:hypothetical protein CYMTET_23582 [Cymbomonas tetramitiformis]